MSSRPLGFDPALWGRAAWSLLYEAALLSPRAIAEKEGKALLLMYAFLLPCEPCRQFTHRYARKFIAREPLPTLFDEVYVLHRAVAAKTKRSIPEADSMRRRYMVTGGDVGGHALLMFMLMVCIQARGCPSRKAMLPYFLQFAERVLRSGAAHRKRVADALSRARRKARSATARVWIAFSSLERRKRHSYAPFVSALQREGRGSTALWSESRPSRSALHIVYH